MIAVELPKQLFVSIVENSRSFVDQVPSTRRSSLDYACFAQSRVDCRVCGLQEPVASLVGTLLPEEGGSFDPQNFWVFQLSPLPFARLTVKAPTGKGIGTATAT